MLYDDLNIDGKTVKNTLQLPSWTPCPMPSWCILLIWPKHQTSLGQTRWPAIACLKTKDKEDVNMHLLKMCQKNRQGPPTQS